jgi:RND family efflux transporter MFP subunit
MNVDSLKSIFKKINKRLWIIFLLIILGMVLGWKFTQAKKKVYQTKEVKRQDLIQFVSASGEVKAQEQVELKFQTSGLMTWVGVKEGDWVKKWQAVAQLDKRELQKTLEKYLRDYSKERNDFDEDYYITYKEQTPSTAMTDTVKRILQKNQWDLDKAVLDVELKDIALKLATLVSPIEGIVTKIEAPVAGVNITPATATFTIANPKVMVFEAEIDEVDIGKIKVGQEAEIVLDAYAEEKFSGTISKINFEAVSTKGGGTAFPVEVVLPENQDLCFKIGMNGEMEIILEKKEAVLVVPNEAIKSKDGQSYVQIMEQGEPKEIQVDLGLEGDLETEVISGLAENQEVVISEKK